MKAIKKYYWLVLFAMFLLVSVWFADYLTLDGIKSNKQWIKNIIAHHYILSVAVFFIACSVFINSPLPMAAVIKVMGGYFFGFYYGAVYNISATLIACLLGFYLSRYALKDLFEAAYYQRLQKVEQEIEVNGFYYFLSLRLVMVVPYFIINVIAGISRVSFKHYLFATVLGVIPSSLIYANGGSKLEQIESVAQLLQPEYVVSLVLLACALLWPALQRK
ncbi:MULTISPECIES: TVP38/TMEM64 family protein [Methylomonas]|uniref:TVP38/TMEM64 family protein n=1 Tax=Methylomonas TaxID=416 RepID=UPI001E58C6C1|nr:VTT domain-containing protein [Methylomonas rhizoryzae]